MAVMTNAGATRSARMIAALRKRWYIIVAAGIIAGMGTYALSTLITPIYHSTASMFFSLRAGDSGSDINQGSTYTQNQMLSFAQLATSAVVLDRVVNDLDDTVSERELRRLVTVTTPQNTVILDVGADTADRDLSAKIANSVAENLTKVVAEVAPVDSAGKSTVAARVIEPAVRAEFQSSPNKQRNALLGALLGVALAFLGFFLSIVFDTRVRSVAALRSMTNRPLLGIAERTSHKDDARPVTVRSPNGSAAERFRQIRAGLRFAAASHEMSIVAVTSSVPGEGKTMTALNLALVMAESKDRILLIDADLRRPRVADYLGLEGTVGLTTVLVGGVTVEDAVQRFGHTTLDVLAAGEVPPNPAELLASGPMRELIDQTRGEYDFVVVDTAPLLSVADASVIAQQADSTVVVADSSKVHQAQLMQTLDLLDSSGAHVSGVILNRVKPSSRRDSYYREYHQEPSKTKTGIHHRVWDKLWERIHLAWSISAERERAERLD
ncbi:polysaccharide biosynthesis tyrosine autokinase [Microbacterium sp. STN6]|uniref:polysaccharide biosynthesis tyrosine autokinase n=1 Tax=Microbacterium sp. STN6 TaxID=2995588 RepID=UPI002260B5C9|nr:polysaccharide biosynthesis tyrosine autokinase [Microbacterium sp. STN6]MCX7523040.1 polysaccharide biosynthesis tyrosine autokinase [Microbacterium sp. STN6]